MSLKRLNINWYPGHMAKGFRLLEEQLSMIDIVVEICDARIPLSSRNEKLQEMIKDKNRLLVLNKEDLADPIETAKWKSYFLSKGIRCISVSTHNINPNKNEIFDQCREIFADKLQRHQEKGRINRPIRLAMTGIPNCGKSTMINSLFAKSSMKTENRPGVTRSVHWLRSNDAKFECLDSPGLLWPKISKDRSALFLAGLGSIREEILDIESIAYYLFIILFQIDAKVMTEYFSLKSSICSSLINNYDLAIYTINNFESEFYDLFIEAAKNRGCIRKGGRADTDRFAKIFIKELRDGKFARMTLEPFNKLVLQNIDRILEG